MKNITEATPKDWEDFWYSPEKFGTWEYYNSESEGKDVDVQYEELVREKFEGDE